MNTPSFSATTAPITASKAIGQKIEATINNPK